METLNVAGTDAFGRLQVFVNDPKPMNAVDRARLYEAAPDLLSALQLLVHGFDLQYHPYFEPRLEKARAAIAKAEGTK